MYSPNIEVFLSMVYPFVLIYILILIILFASRYLKAYTKNKRLIFTQEAITQKRKEIDIAIEKITPSIEEKMSHVKNSVQMEATIIRVLSIYNEFAIGINEGIYDELYVKMALGYDMIDFYKRYGYGINHSVENPLSRFLPLELLLKRWDSNEAPSYRIKKWGRML